jgi:Flp pilus assembly protein TadG
MTKHRSALAFAKNEEGFTLFYMAVFLTCLCIFVGLAVDTGRAYVVQAQLSKAVDGAALGAARALNSGNPRGEAATIYRANFPNGWFGTTSSTDPSASSFYQMSTVTSSGVNIVTVTASAVVPTTFMGLANFRELTVHATGEATRRMVDLSLVIDKSGSIGWKWPYVQAAAADFVSSFSATSDRLSLIFFSDGARVADAMPAGRGFDKNRLVSDINGMSIGGSTAMVEGLYRGWDELRSVSNGQQSGLRVIVLFTDGASNSVPGIYDASGIAKGLRTYDFPKNSPDPDSQTWNNPTIAGLYDTETGNGSPTPSTQVPNWDPSASACPQATANCLSSVPFLPVQTFHSHHRSSGIPTWFPLQSNSLKVDGVTQSTARGLRNFNSAQSKYPAELFNINNAARNLVEIIADAARSDTGGDYPIRIYTIGMGELVRYQLGMRRETSESILKRMANDPSSPDHNPNQLDGAYYFAATADDVGPAFAALQNQIIRLTK